MARCVFLTPRHFTEKLVCYCSQHEKFQSAPGSRVGTPAYLAPEVILTTKGKTYDGKVQSGRRHMMKPPSPVDIPNHWPLQVPQCN